MKKIISLLFTSLLVVSCSFLDEEPRSELPEEAFITDAASLYNNTVGRLYNHIGGSVAGEGLQGTYRGVYDLQTFTTDEALIPTRGGDWYDGGLWQQLFLHTWQPDNEALGNAWKYLYKVIVLSNYSLQTLNDYHHLINDTQFEMYCAEVRAIRAICYAYLLDLFARVPIVIDVDVDLKDVSQSERHEVFRFVETELCDAMEWLPDVRSTVKNDYYGHVSLSVAAFAMMKLALNAEVWTDDDWTDTDHPDGKDIKIRCFSDSLSAWKAVGYYAELIRNSGLALDESQTMCFAVHNETSAENIFTIPMDYWVYQNRFSNQFRSLHYQHGAALGYAGENGSCATRETLRTFGYNTNDVDCRFALSFFADTVYAGEQPLVLLSGDTLVYKALDVQLDLTYSPFIATAGARMYKYAIDPAGFWDGTMRQNDIVLFRYAEVLLMEAEAKVRNGQNGQTEFDLVRNRETKFRTGHDNTPREATLCNILEERKLELVWEGWRRQDMIRFGIFTSSYSDRPALPGEKVVEGFESSWQPAGGYTTVFPVPQNAIEMNANLTQNIGYR